MAFDVFNPYPDLAKVKLNDDFRRVERLPRRVWSAEAAEGLAGELTDILARPGGTMRLRPIQAVALYEIGTVGGLFGPLRVGAGKTLISLLAPVVADKQRPLLLVPAKLVDKTNRDRAVLAKHFDLPDFVRVMSYEWLGRAQAAAALEAYEPDIVIADECHKLKNRKAAVTRRVWRWFLGKPECQFVGMSGTITKRSLHDFAHILQWALKPDAMPLPQGYNDLELWANALDERKGQELRADPGALTLLCDEREADLEPRQGARRAYRRRLIETPGVVATKETPIDASITIATVEPAPNAQIEEAFATLRRRWETPDGWPIADGLGMYRHARELALGFYYVWDPRPPKYWLEARKEWCVFVRAILKHSRTLDSELQVKQAHQLAPELATWLAVKDDFEPNTVPVWLNNHAIDFCTEWLYANNGIVWTEHTHFAERLSRHSRSPYFGRGGKTSAGRAIEDCPPGTPMIASIASNAEGRNLQAWSKNLIASPPPNGLQWEQLLGRTHRDGQQADEVTFDVLANCVEHYAAIWQAIADCEFVHDTTGSPQKLLVADLSIPSVDDLQYKNGPQWVKA